MAKRRKVRASMKMPVNTAPMPTAAMKNSIPSPKVMPMKAEPLQPNHPRIAQAKRLNNNMTRAMAGRKRGG